MKLKTLLILLTLWVPVALGSNGLVVARVNGEEIGPVRTPLGWHLIGVQNHLEAADVSEQQGLDSVRAYLARQQHAQVRLQVLAQLRSRNRIERIDDD